jgi:hypothetical protein
MTQHSERTWEIRRLLLQGEKEIEAGRGYDLDAVLTEADTLLKKAHTQALPLPREVKKEQQAAES